MSTYGNLCFTVTIGVSRCDADVVFFCKRTTDDMLFPSGIFIPSHIVLIYEENVVFSVAIDVGDFQSVADSDFIIDRLRSDQRRGAGEG